MSRKKKKGKHKRKKKKIVLSQAENQACWNWAKAVTKMERDKSLYHLKFFCPDCSMSFCIGGDGIESYCRGCYINSAKEEIEKRGGIFTGCVKETTGRRTCHECGG